MNDNKLTRKIVVNREKTCPLLLRMFCSNGKHHDPTEFINGSTPTSSSELQIYTWMDANLEELTNLIQEVNPDCRTRGTVFDFCIVYPDLKSDRYRMKTMGTVVSGVNNEDNAYTLKVWPSVLVELRVELIDDDDCRTSISRSATSSMWRSSSRSAAPTILPISPIAPAFARTRPGGDRSMEIYLSLSSLELCCRRSFLCRRSICREWICVSLLLILGGYRCRLCGIARWRGPVQLARVCVSWRVAGHPNTIIICSIMARM